jgi:hypothetical protein
MTLVAVCSEINLSFKAQSSRVSLTVKYTHRLSIYCFKVYCNSDFRGLVHFPCSCLIQAFFFQLIAQYLVLLLHVSTTKRGHRQGATVFENIMQRGT